MHTDQRLLSADEVFEMKMFQQLQVVLGYTDAGIVDVPRNKRVVTQTLVFAINLYIYINMYKYIYIYIYCKKMAVGTLLRHYFVAF